MHRLAIILALVLVASTGVGQITEANASQVMADVAKRNQGWTSKLNSPGTSLKLVEVRRELPAIFFELMATGFAEFPCVLCVKALLRRDGHTTWE